MGGDISSTQSSGFDFSGLAGLSSQLNTGSGSNSTSSPLSTLTSSIPVVGGLLSSLGGIVGGLLGGHGAPDHEASDRGRIAATNNITDQQAADVCGYEEQHVSDNYDAIVKRAANDNSYFLQLVAKYNQAHPSTPVVPGSYTGTQTSASMSLGTTSGLLPQNINSLLGGGSSLTSILASLGLQQNSPVPASSSLTAQQIKDAAGAAYNGAVKGATDSLMQTDEGKAATKAGAEQFVKDNGWWLAPLGLVAGFGIYKAATK